MSDRIIQVDRHDGNGYQDYPLDKWIAEHPEDFKPVINGQIVGSIPFDPFTFGHPDSNGDIVVDNGTQVSIEQVGDQVGDDVLVLCTDGCGNEWWEKP